MAIDEKLAAEARQEFEADLDRYMEEWERSLAEAVPEATSAVSTDAFASIESAPAYAPVPLTLAGREFAAGEFVPPDAWDGASDSERMALLEAGKVRR